MNEPLDETRLRDALAAEADQARPDPHAWEKVSGRVALERSHPALLGAAALVLVLAGVAAAITFWPDESDEPLVVEPPDTTTTTEPAETTTTETPETTTTTTPEPEIVVDPIDMGPTPPTRATRPDTIVAVLPDGWLAMADTATGEVIDELEFRGDLREESEEGPRYGIADVAVAPDRSHLWYAFCCEPAAGALFRIPDIDGHGSPGGDYPMFTLGSRWFASASLMATVWNSEEGTGRFYQPEPPVSGFSRAVLAPDGQRLVVVPWASSGPGLPMFVVETDTVLRTAQAGMTSDSIIDDDPVELPGDRWTLPTFRRDGLLLVAEEADDGSWSPRLVDIDTFEVTDPGFDYGPGTPVMQRFDGSGEWLLTLMTDDPDAFPAEGRLVWHGPDGQQGTIPGSFVSAAW